MAPLKLEEVVRIGEPILQRVVAEVKLQPYQISNSNDHEFYALVTGTQD